MTCSPWDLTAVASFDAPESYCTMTQRYIPEEREFGELLPEMFNNS